jgi:hypothetical protein
LPGKGFTKDSINYVRVTLNAKDTYEVEFSRVRGRNVTIVYIAHDIYASQLQELFTTHTGLSTSMGTRIDRAIRDGFNNRHED